MLNELIIDNVAVIEHAAVSFGGGFNVLTGETGAGKSILIDSINAILGNRTTREIVRTGAQKSSILASFSDIPASVAAKLTDMGYDYDDTLILARDITAEGKSACRINSKPATAAVVREIAGDLVNIHGQLDNQELLDPLRHIDILDRYADIDLDAYRVLFAKLNETVNEIQRLTKSERDKAARIDLLRYQVNEIDAADLKIGEEEELTQRRAVIQNSEKIAKVLSKAVSGINGDDSGENEGAYSMLYDLCSDLDRLAPVSEVCSVLSEKLRNAYYALEDAVNLASGGLDSLDFSQEDLNAVEDRLDLIHKLKRKYGNDIAEILSYRDDAEKELSTLEFSEEYLEQLQERFRQLKSETLAMASNISKKRIASFEGFQSAIKGELEFLNMPSVVFIVDRHKTTELNDKGFDDIQFLISANLGESPRPLSKIASGGEMSRIMLAIKSVMADKDGVPTLIFDEIDTGVSGKSAQRIGEKIKQTSRHHQIICVTHSAQVAAYAAKHMKIEKAVKETRTFTTVTVLDDEQRVAELARIISGDNITEISLKNAQEILSIASCS